MDTVWREASLPLFPSLTACQIIVLPTSPCRITVMVLAADKVPQYLALQYILMRT